MFYGNNSLLINILNPNDASINRAINKLLSRSMGLECQPKIEHMDCKRFAGTCLLRAINIDIIRMT